MKVASFLYAALTIRWIKRALAPVVLLSLFSSCFNAMAEEVQSPKTTIRVSITADRPEANPLVTLDAPGANAFLSEKIKNSAGATIYLLNVGFTFQQDTINFSPRFFCDGPQDTHYVAWIRGGTSPFWNRLLPVQSENNTSLPCGGPASGEPFTSNQTNTSKFQIVVIVGPPVKIENTGFFAREGAGVYSGVIKSLGQSPGAEANLGFSSRNGGCSHVDTNEANGEMLSAFMSGQFDFSVEEEGRMPLCKFYRNGVFYVETVGGLSRLRYMGRHTLSSQLEADVLSQEVAFLEPLFPGDTNADEKVDLKDLGVVKQNFDKGCSEGYSCGDFNGDSKVDLKDLGLIKQTFNQQPEFKACATPEDFLGSALPGIGLPENGGCQ